MRKSALISTFTLLSLAAAGPTPLSAQGAAEQQLGNVHFATSCNEAAQRRFDRAMRYQHSFWYRASYEIFEEVLKADPACAIAYWGMALSLWNNPHNPPPAPNIAPALAAIEKAQALGAKTERERDYIDALALLYKDHDKTPYAARLQAYLRAMEALARKYPDDDEAQIAYAITLNVSASPADKTYAQQIKGVEILDPLSKRLPLHPGVTHYLIHLYDYPALAEKGLEAANRYARIAPDAPHAQHMPSHIYTRIGYWKESIASNTASANAARVSKEAGDELHGRDYLVYAYLQLGRDQDARSAIAEMANVAGLNPSVFTGHFALAAAPARYAIERGDWEVAASLPVRPSNFPHVMAITHFARALGAARLGKPDDARADVAQLVELRDKLRETRNAYWAEQVDIQWQVATAWVLNAEGKHQEAVAAMKAAADAEDTTEKAPVTPGPLAPARELYGQMLLDRGMAQEAVAAFEATMSKEPNRFGGFAGAALAAAALGDTTRAKAHYQSLVALVGDGAGERPEITAARSFLAKN